MNILATFINTIRFGVEKRELFAGIAVVIVLTLNADPALACLTLMNTWLALTEVADLVH